MNKSDLYGMGLVATNLLMGWLEKNIILIVLSFLVCLVCAYVDTMEILEAKKVSSDE